MRAFFLRANAKPTQFEDFVTEVACRATHQTRLSNISIDDRDKIVLNNFLTAATEDNCPQEARLRSFFDIIFARYALKLYLSLQKYCSDF